MWGSIFSNLISKGFKTVCESQDPFLRNLISPEECIHQVSDRSEHRNPFKQHLPLPPNCIQVKDSRPDLAVIRRRLSLFPEIFAQRKIWSESKKLFEIENQVSFPSVYSKSKKFRKTRISRKNFAEFWLVSTR